jgi:hypothetical protein
MSANDASLSRLLRFPWLALWLLVALSVTGLSVRRGLVAGRNADVDRQWIVAQYVRAGINPYAVCLHALQHTYGRLDRPDRIRLREVKIYDTHGTTWDPAVVQVLPDYGPPTATYPPSAVWLFGLSLGAIPHGWLHGLWAVVNAAALAILVLRQVRPGLPAGVLLLAALAWPPTQDVWVTNQFCFPALLALDLCWRTRPGQEAAAGCWLALALVKPSFALLFVLPLLFTGRWRAVALAGCLHVAAILALAVQVRASPVAMLSDWLGIAKYMLQGAYSIQEFINRAGWDNTLAGSFCTYGFLGLIVAWSWWHRRAGAERLVAFLCVASLTWTYHERYDYVLLLPLALQVAQGVRMPVRAIGWKLIFVVLGLSITDLVYASDTDWAWVIRWSGRAALAALFALTAWSVRLEACRRDGRP